MRLGDRDAVYLSLPPNLQNAENQALCRAVDEQFTALMDFFKKMLFWGDLENVDEEYYDAIAANLRALYYDSSLDREAKFRILSEALQTYMYAGTLRANQKLLDNVFPGAVFVPWYEYGGEPYHFKIVAPTSPTEDTLERFMAILKEVKSQRSIMDGLETREYPFTLDVHAASGMIIWGRMEERSNRDD